MKSLQGHFLVASPHLPDPNFYRTVVLMLQHDAEGALGVILNRPGRSTVAQLARRMKLGASDRTEPVYLGGPVDGPPLAIHTYAPAAQSEIMPGLFLTSRRERLQRAVGRAQRLRCFVGYAGWSAGQLDAELDVGGWLVAPASVKEVFQDIDGIWKRLTGRIGLEILAPTIGRQPVPEHAWLN